MVFICPITFEPLKYGVFGQKYVYTSYMFYQTFLFHPFKLNVTICT